MMVVVNMSTKTAASLTDSEVDSVVDDDARFRSVFLMLFFWFCKRRET